MGRVLYDSSDQHLWPAEVSDALNEPLTLTCERCGDHWVLERYIDESGFMRVRHLAVPGKTCHPTIEIEPVVFLDVDGVYADFVSAGLRAHGSALTPNDITRYDMAGIMGISGTEFWEPLDAAGPEFWRDLELFPWSVRLYAELKALPADVVFLTQPSWSWTTLAGKKMFFDKHFGRSFMNFIPTGRKELLAHHPRSVLIDDSPENVEKFEAAGGKAILFPQPWNGTTVPEDEDIVGFIVDQARRALGPCGRRGLRSPMP